jgi:hypothetical protein
MPYIEVFGGTLKITDEMMKNFQVGREERTMPGAADFQPIHLEKNVGVNWNFAPDDEIVDAEIIE